ncbi:MAG TPA: tetratricopeptide repeat protein [Dokdonella sp.]|uniref:tetratricopeptide repeat protein n=1 Tax=Dokdonella sp. TaxID=2291710 RepID=UPI002D7F49C6|nr:tetratricopeptide repeat protein [Dokdonella sp.]HET9032603.1 tetratricopeptide repeat protein [Dokdonella sp.]
MNDQLDNIATLISQGRPDLAADQAAQLRNLYPDAVEPARLHGVALLSMGKVDEAIVVLKQASALNPQSVETLCNLGSALLARKDARAALIVMQSAQTIAADHPAALNGLGNAQRAVGDHEKARDAYQAATRIAPGFLGAWLNLAATELALGQHSQCEQILRMILKQTAHPEALLLLAQTLMAQRRLDEAATACLEAEKLAPEDARFPYQLGQIADELKQAGIAVEAHARAFKLDPGLSGALAQWVFIKRQLCDWQDLDTLSNQLRGFVNQGAADIAPFGFLAEPASAAEQHQCAVQFAAGIADHVDPMATRSAPAHPTFHANRPLRVGFASNGFGNHPTGLLSVAFFEALAEHTIELHLFATTTADGSPIQQRLQAAARAWHALDGLTSQSMAERIAAQELDILIDLRVWGGGNISEALALRPAPIQVNWLAYPGTSGAHWIDYIIADRQVLPATAKAHYSEAVAWLPRCFQPSDCGRIVADPPTRTECGLPESAPVFVCFNNSYKLDPRSVRRMCEILKAVPDAVLWLLSGPANSNDNLRAIATKAGIEPTRLVFMNKLPQAEYLARYRHADLFLDTAHYNAHTTASDAIWAGCPVLTSAGETFASRVAASLNHHLGMDELNVADDAAYVEFATRIGRDRNARNALHARLAQQRSDSPLFDMQGFADDFHNLLKRMVDRQRKGLMPASID